VNGGLVEEGHVDWTSRYPKTKHVRAGTEVVLRVMDAGDGERVLRFAQSLPADDILFLRSDITQPAGVAYWVANIENGTTATLLAEVDGTVVGYASVHQSPAAWTRRVGEIRVNVGPEHRGAGLGRLLVGEIVDVARTLGLRKLSAQMTMEQQSAQAAFRRLGFRVEAVLADWVEDRLGRPRDLLIMAFDLDGLTNQVDEPLES
jgi:L-amino acid N-acyltransferase YncA